MGNLSTHIQGSLVEYDIEYRVHATRRMFQRFIGDDDIERILEKGQVIEKYDDFPLPSILLNGQTASGRALHVVVGVNESERKLVIITTYEPDPVKWGDSFSRRL